MGDNSLLDLLVGLVWPLLAQMHWTDVFFDNVHYRDRGRKGIHRQGSTAGGSMVRSLVRIPVFLSGVLCSRYVSVGFLQELWMFASVVDPAMDWWPVQVIPCLSPKVSWLAPAPHTTPNRLSGVGYGWMAPHLSLRFVRLTSYLNILC